jgi:cystathionine gamma-synthase/cystathionine gamma-lyase
MNFSTKAIHAGQEPDKSTGSIITPIYQTSTYFQEGVNIHKGYEYSRTGNPTRSVLETCLAALENGKHGLAFASGLAAEHAILSLLKPGDHVIAAADMYGGTYRLFEEIFKPLGLKFSYVDGAIKDFEAAITPETKMFWIETPTNPLLKVYDISSLSDFAKRNHITVTVDNTFATPYFQQPLTLGADIVIHSTTKYIGGHSDIVGGAVIINHEEIHNRLKFLQNAIGAIPGPFDSWLTLRGLKTLALRMRQHQQNALALAQFLEKHSEVEHVFYPGLSSSPYYALAKEQMKGGGGMLSFRLRNANIDNVNHFFTGLKIISLAESLGGVESLVCYPAMMTHGSIPLESRLKIGVTDNLIRLSPGIEDTDDLLNDLAEGLKAYSAIFANS